MLSECKEQPVKLFNFRQKIDLTEKHRFELLFMFAHYLNRAQVKFAFDKFRPPNEERYILKKRGKKLPPCPQDMHHCRLEILRLLAHHENFTLRRTDNEDSWITEADIQAFTLWEMVREKSGLVEGNPKPLPSTAFFIKQSVAFIQHQNILPDFLFGRTEISEDETETDKQKLIYSASSDFPLRIRHNTVLAQNRCNNQKINFGALALRGIILMYLDNQQPNDIQNKIKKWLAENTPKITPAPTISLSKAEQISNKLSVESHKAQSVKDTGTLQDKIRFIAHMIGDINAHVTEQALSATAYKKLEEKIRYFRKTELHNYIQEELGNSVYEHNWLGTPSEKSKSLKNLINKDRLEDVCAEIVSNYQKWLDAQNEKLHSLGEEELDILSKRLRVKPPRTEATEQTQPVGLPPAQIREWMDKKSEASILLRLCGSLLTVKPEDLPDTPKKNQHAKHAIINWWVLLAMSVDQLKRLNQNKLKDSNENTDKERLNFDKKSVMQPISEMGVHYQLPVNGKSVNLKVPFGNNWRSLLRKSTRLGAAYLPQDAILTLHKPDKPSEMQASIQEAIYKWEREAFIFIQAILKYESEIAEQKLGELRDQAKKTKKSYLSFKLISSHLKLNDDTKKLRNCAFHADATETPFSKCPDRVIAEHYTQIETEMKQNKKIKARQGRKKSR